MSFRNEIILGTCISFIYFPTYGETSQIVALPPVNLENLMNNRLS